MFLYLLYWLLSPILWILLFPACLINAKIRHHWLTENRSWKSASKKIKMYGNGKTVVLFHAASSGEFEQLQPVLKEMDRNKFFILQSFFSPTVYIKEKEKNTHNPIPRTVLYWFLILLLLLVSHEIPATAGLPCACLICDSSSVKSKCSAGV